MCEAKIIHSRTVAANCRLIAESLGFDAYDTGLAWIIGELHDFARFGQIVVTHTFKDTAAFNHAHFGAALLFDHELIDDLIPTTTRCPTKTGRLLRRPSTTTATSTCPTASRRASKHIATSFATPTSSIFFARS